MPALHLLTLSDFCGLSPMNLDIVCSHIVQLVQDISWNVQRGVECSLQAWIGL